jgi:hypothetical protein
MKFLFTCFLMSLRLSYTTISLPEVAMYGLTWHWVIGTWAVSPSCPDVLTRSNITTKLSVKVQDCHSHIIPLILSVVAKDIRSRPIGWQPPLSIKIRLSDEEGGVYGPGASGPGAANPDTLNIAHSQEDIIQFYHFNAERGDPAAQVDESSL